MDRRKFIWCTALLSSTTLLINQSVLASVPSLPTHYVGIGRGACRVIDYLKKTAPHLEVTKAPGVDLDMEQSALLGLPILTGQPVRSVIQPLVDTKSPLVIVYCLGGKSNVAGMLDFIKKLKQTERQFKLVLQFPFSFEGTKRSNTAIEIADQLSFIAPFKSVHANHLRNKQMDLNSNFELLNQQIANLILEEDN